MKPLEQIKVAIEILAKKITRARFTVIIYNLLLSWKYFHGNMLAPLFDPVLLDPKCSIEEKFTQLESLSGLLETENFLIERFLEAHEGKSRQSENVIENSLTPKANQFASLQRKIDIADKTCIAIRDEVEQLEIKSNDKLRNLKATKSELDLSCEEAEALRQSLEQKFQSNGSSDRCKRPDNLNKFIETWSYNCKQKREKAHMKATLLKRLCIREAQDVASKSQVIKQVSPAEYVKLQFDSKGHQKLLEEFRTQTSKLRKDHAVVLSRKITENRKSIEIAKTRRKILAELKSMQTTDDKLRNECDHMVETIAQMEKQIEDFRERVSATEFPRVNISDYANCKDRCEKLASVVKVVERKMSLAKKSTC